MSLKHLAFAAVLALSAAAQPASAAPAAKAAANATQAGEFLVEPPTLINLGFEWSIAGDDNRNAKVEVSYRKKGETAWKQAMPLMRMQGENVYWGAQKADDHVIKAVVPNMFAGSILDLEPDTAYETRFVLTDPDGVKGKSVQVATVRTRAEPKPASGGRVFHVYPTDWKGAKEPNAYVGLNCAYNYHCGGGDESLANRPRVKAGDTILVHAGVYESFWDWYSRASSTRPVEGTYYLFGKGTAEKPIVIKAAGDGEVIFDGRGNFTLFNLQAAPYHYFEGITFRNTEIAIQAGLQMIAGTVGLTVKRSRFENVNIGINTSYSGSRDFYIADNTFIGRHDPRHLQNWSNDRTWLRFNGVEGQTFPVKLQSYAAVRVYGQGHVVAYNYVANFHDGIDVETYGNPDGSDAVNGPFYPPREFWDRRTLAIDFYNNYLTNFHDNAIETDGSMHNIRVMRNIMINSASHAICNQPSIGGPVYWVRNIVYNSPSGAARFTSGSPGVFFLNNTIFSEFAAGSVSNATLLNNLFLGQNSGPSIYAVTSFTSYDVSDHNGFRPNAGVENSFVWTSPPAGVAQDFRDLLDPDRESRNAPMTIKTLQRRSFASLSDYSQATGHDRNSILLDYDAFENVKPLDAQDYATLQRLYDARDMDFRLKPGAAPVDKGVIIPTVTDGYAGAAPDMGALESGRPLPHYGPR
jgi:hypothetical protein